MTIVKLPARSPVVPYRSLALTEEGAERQIQKGLFLTERGERFALPFDDIKTPERFRGVAVWERAKDGSTVRKGTRLQPRQSQVQKRVLSWLRDNVHRDIPYNYYQVVLGHDLHVSTFANLYGSHWHRGWADPLTGMVSRPLDPSFATLRDTHWRSHECDLPVCPAKLEPYWANMLAKLEGEVGFVENLGWLSGAKVTDAFVSEIVDELVSTTGTEFADFDQHEVGTSSTAENNDHTALQATSGIARAAGTPTDADPIYRNVATITADASETWEEHGLFNNTSGAAMMDRNLTGGQAVVATDQVQYTYELTVNPEA